MKENDNKKATTFWLRPSMLKRIDAALPLTKCGSRSEFAEDALRYYIDHLIGEDVEEYISEDLLKAVRQITDENNKRLRSLIFKWSVELNMLCHTMAAHYRVDEIDRRALRAFAVDEVKQTGGQVSFDHALDVQRQYVED